MYLDTLTNRYMYVCNIKSLFLAIFLFVDRFLQFTNELGFAQLLTEQQTFHSNTDIST